MAKNKIFSAKMGKQISVFLENRPGTLAKVIDVLRGQGVNMLALSLSEGLELGYLRIVVDQHDKATKILRDTGHLIFDRDVVFLEVANEPGGLAAAIDIWAKNGVNIDYAYCGSGTAEDKSLIVARVNDSDKALRILNE